MDYTVAEFGELAGIPSVGSSDKIAGDALDGLERRTAFGTFLLLGRGILISADRAVVAVMVDAAISDVVFVHQVNNIHYRLRIMGGIAVNLNIEDMSAAGQFVIGGLHLGLMTGGAMIIDRNVV